MLGSILPVSCAEGKTPAGNAPASPAGFAASQNYFLPQQQLRFALWNSTPVSLAG